MTHPSSHVSCRHLCAIVIAVVAAAAFAQEPARARRPVPEDIRSHYVLRRAADKEVLYEITSVLRMKDEVHHTILLVDDREHGRFLIENRMDFPQKQSLNAISDLSRRDFLRVEYEWQGSATTLKKVIEEMSQIPPDAQPLALQTVTTGGGEWRIAEKEHSDAARMHRLRYEIRRSAPAFLLEAIERMRGTFLTTSEGTTFYHVLGLFLLYGDAPVEGTAMEQAEATPDCAFDDEFGFPCSASMKDRIKKAAEEGRTLRAYF